MNQFFFSLLFLSLFSCSAQHAIPQPKSVSLVEDVVKETNKFRRTNQLPALISKDELNALAQKHSADMASGRVAFSHAGFDERSKKAKKIITGTKGRFAENVAYGSSTAKEVLNGWENSPGHRKNILGSYKYLGVGIAADRKGTLYFTQIFVD